MPVVLTISGDGAAFDIGFGAMSRVLAMRHPDQVPGAGHRRLLQHRRPGLHRELPRPGRRPRPVRRARTPASRSTQGARPAGRLHPGVFVASTAAAFHGHFLRATADMLGYHDGAALMVTYAPCDTENGMAEDLANARSRLAVESRMSPLFVHDPRRGRAWPSGSAWTATPLSTSAGP